MCLKNDTTNGRQLLLYKLSMLTNPVYVTVNAVTLLIRLKRGQVAHLCPWWTQELALMTKHREQHPIPGSITDLVTKVRGAEACSTMASGKGDGRFAGLPHALIVQIFWKFFFVSIRKVGRERQALTEVLVCRQRRVLDLH